MQFYMNKFIDTPFPFFLSFIWYINPIGTRANYNSFGCSLVGKDLLPFTSLGARYHLVKWLHRNHLKWWDMQLCHIFSLSASLLWRFLVGFKHFLVCRTCFFLGGGETFVSCSAGLSTKPGNFAFLSLFLS